MSLYYSVIVTRKLLCDCSAYRFHHSVGTGICSSYEPINISSLPLKVSAQSLRRAIDLINHEQTQSSLLQERNSHARHEPLQADG